MECFQPPRPGCCTVAPRLRPWLVGRSHLGFWRLPSGHEEAIGLTFAHVHTGGAEDVEGIGRFLRHEHLYRWLCPGKSQRAVGLHQHTCQHGWTRDWTTWSISLALRGAGCNAAVP